MVTNWSINGGREPSSLYHVSKEGAEYAERSVNGTMGNLLNSYSQNRGFVDEPIKKRLTNSDAEFIAQKNINGSMANILHRQNEKSIMSQPQPARGVPRLKSSEALEIQAKSLNGSMSEIMNTSQSPLQAQGSHTKQIRAKTEDAKTNVTYGQNGSIGPLVLNPGSTNVCEDKVKYEDMQRRAADAKNAMPVERVRYDDASNNAKHGKTGTFGILNGNSITPNDAKSKQFSQSVKQGFVASQQTPVARARNEAATNNMNHGNIGKLGVLLQGKPLPVNSDRNRYNEGVTRALTAEVAPPVPRVRPEAADIAEHHKGHVQNLIADVTNKPKLALKKSASIDQLNYNRMKKKEREGQKKVTQSTDSKPLWKNSKYDRTESRLKQWMDTTYGPNSRPGTAEGRPGTGGKRPGTAEKRPGAGGKRPGSAPLRRSASDSCLKRNFVAENARKAKAAPIRVDPMKVEDARAEKRKDKESKCYQKGVVPEYLQDRVKQWKEEEKERIANMPDPTVPPGHVVMNKKEKEETLSILLKSKEKLLDQLHNLPLRNDTLRLHNTRNELEGKLSEIDDAVKIFSRPRVFIKQD